MKLKYNMTQEEKDLLLKDLCARLPYGVKVKHEAQDFPSTLLWVDTDRLSVGRKADKKGVGSDWGSIEFIKPYLRPMSSMTEEEKKEYESTFDSVYDVDDYGEDADSWHKEFSICSLDWLLKHHFDYRGLIEKGLAIEVTEENNPYKNLKI